MSLNPEFLLSPGESVDGFAVRRVQKLAEFRSIAYELEHAASGARLLHLHNDDGENLFSVTFPTPPPDDTGVPHILEHCVLGGSRKYAVKDPFFEMVKCSMATFINAMTATDHTVYPVASNVKRDFYNLTDVYWDAVFHPKLTEMTFQREGHHLEFAVKGDLASDLILKGIVYNEMKGARSSPESIIFDVIEKALWPDTPYGRDSGGDPDHIPELTYENFKQFHKTHYHPSNGYIFLYGDIPTREHLKFLAPRLQEFTRQPPDADLPLQPLWTSPRSRADQYPVGPDDPVTAKTYINVNWLVGDAVDMAELLNLSALELILLGHQAAPLRKALIDSHLGEDVWPAGLWPNGKQCSFHIGLKGSEPDRTEKVQSLILQTLTEIADAGVTPAQAEAAFQQLAYHFLEIASMFPLHLMGRAVHLWMHSRDPLLALRAGDELAALRKRFAQDPQLFSRLIRDRLLNNTHRLTITATPDRELQGLKDARFSQKMRDLKSSLSPRQLQDVADQQVKLDALADAPNTPEALAALPRLQVRDLPRVPRHIPTTLEELPSITLLRNDVFANGVNYLHLTFDLSALPPELLPYLPLYADCVSKMGAAKMNYAELAQRVAAHTGGVHFSHSANSRVDGPGALRRGTFTMKFLDEKVEPAMSVLHDLAYALDCTDEARLTDVLSQVRSYHRTRAATEGLALALRRARRDFTAETYVDEIWQGVPQTRLIERLAEAAHAPLIEKLQSIGRWMSKGGKPTASFTGSDSVWPKVRSLLAEWTSRADTRGMPPAPIHQPPSTRLRQGLAGPMNVAYCAMVMPAPRIWHPQAALLSVGARIVSFNHVLEEVRFKGTAYGGGCGYGGSLGLWEFHSYRDPWIWRTLDVYNASMDFVRKSDWPQAEVDRAIIGTAKEFERPIRPGEATGNSLWRHLTGDTPARREARHAAMLEATPAAVKRALLDVFEAGFPRATVCVVSSRQKLEQANTERPATPLEIEDILAEA
jgi:presequence protease